MAISKPHPALLTVLILIASGCSSVGTSMTQIGRVGKNRGYEIQAGELTVQQAAIAVLTVHGYDVSVKADPENGAEGAGVIVIGQRKVDYKGAPVEGTMAGESAQLDTRDLVDVYLSKKWQMGSDVAAPGITLIDIVGGNYVRKDAGADEVETPITAESIALLRDEIERRVNAIRADKAAAAE